MNNILKVAIVMLALSICLLCIVYPQENKENDVNKLIQKLKDEDAVVRKNAAEALVKKGARAVEPLIAALKDENKDVRGYAAWALAEI